MAGQRTARRLTRVLAALMTLLVVTASARVAAAQPEAVVRVEVEHLIGYVEHSGCDFFRNGSWYAGARAGEHLRTKYEYLLKRDQIRSAEDFIVKAASFSSNSSLPYRVRCAGQPQQLAGAWLSKELVRSRRAAVATRSAH